MFHMPMSSPMMTTMLGFLPPLSTAAGGAAPAAGGAVVVVPAAGCAVAQEVVPSAAEAVSTVRPYLMRLLFFMFLLLVYFCVFVLPLYNCKIGCYCILSLRDGSVKN